MKKINFKQPKFIIPALLFLYLAVMGYFLINFCENKSKNFKKNIPEKECIDSNEDVFENIKVWLGNAGNFFGDIFTKGAIKVYSEPIDSINLK